MTFSKRHRIIDEDKLYNWALFILTLISVLQRNVYFKDNSFFLSMCEVIEIAAYCLFVFIIISKRYSAKGLVCLAILGMLLLYGYYASGMAVFFRSMLMIFAAKNNDFNKMIRAMQCAIFSGIFVSSMLYFVGLAPDYFSRSHYHYEGMGFGFGGGNAIGELVCILVMMECYITIKKGKKINYLAVFAICCLLYVFSTSKTATLLTFCTPIAIGFCQYFFKNAGRKKRRFIAYSINPFLFVFAYVTAKLFPVNKFVQDLDLLLTNRIFLNWYAITKYPLKLFGQEVFLHDTGVFNEVRGMGNITVTVDNSYTLALVSLGVIPSLIFAIGYILTVRKAIKENNLSLVGIAILLCAYGFSEVQMLDVYYNFISLSLMAACELLSKHKETTQFKCDINTIFIDEENS